MANTNTNTNTARESLEQSAALSPFVRAGQDGGCMLCTRPIADHIDHRGKWLGCKATDPNVPLIIIPDRRAMNARVKSGEVQFNRRSTDQKPATLPQERRTPKRMASVSAIQKRVREVVSGPQVAYVARYPVTHTAINRLPPHDRKVYGLIARLRKGGATRKHLLDALNATKATGRVDGAVRRLRLRHVITVRPL